MKHIVPAPPPIVRNQFETVRDLFSKYVVPSYGRFALAFGHDEGRFEILTALNSFHGRTLAGIAATGQEKVKKGFEPMVTGFRHVPYNNLQAMRDAISPATAAIMIEGVQGEGGITPASPEYLLGLRKLCDEKK